MDKTIANLKKLKSFHNGSYGADIDKAIKALEQERGGRMTDKIYEYNGDADYINRADVNMYGFKPCPFCGGTDIDVTGQFIEQRMTPGGPCSHLSKVWAYCRRCGCNGRTSTVDTVYDYEIIAAATQAWNRRKGEE